MHNFIEGLKGQTRMLLDTSARATIRTMIEPQVKDLIENMLLNEYHLKSERSVKIETTGTPKDVLPSSSGGFKSNTVDNPKNETCNDLEAGFEVITNIGKDKVVEEVLIEKDDVGSEKEGSENQSDKVEKGVTIEQLIDKKSPWRRTKKQILNDHNPELPNCVKPPYPLIKKRPLQEDEAWLFTGFKEMLTKLQELLTVIKQKLDKEHVNMTEKCDTTLLHTMLTKLKDLSKFTISCIIGGVESPHALCDLGSSINLTPLNKANELNLGAIMPSDVTLTLADLFVNHPHGVLQDVLLYVDGLVFPANFVVVDMKGDTWGSVILRCPFLEI
ncbi:uncharacterized protein LOC127094210 [Lathyrus oleraceus]|uniref:uncharacterized protein LOC127094210 n=1 Tax=Pisum sativum TaxID=3888 RepID=UPI0021D0F232|nr:uncharacterized protein LOC127094210 [Pisum sativum]